MSGTAIVRYLLANNTPLVAVVPAARIMAGALPLNTVLPAISVTQVSGVPFPLIKTSETSIHKDRVQVTVLATTYPEQKSILALVRAAVVSSHGTVNGLAVDGITRDTEGPDVYSDNPIIYTQSQDHIVRFPR